MGKFVYHGIEDSSSDDASSLEPSIDHSPNSEVVGKKPGPLKDISRTVLEDGTEGFVCKMCPRARLTSTGDVAAHIQGKVCVFGFSLIFHHVCLAMLIWYLYVISMCVSWVIAHFSNISLHLEDSSGRAEHQSRRVVKLFPDRLF